MARNRYGYRTRYFRTDGERTLGGKFNNLIASLGITTERSAPATPAQNGAAERSGGVIVIKARCLRITANLPANLWPETVKTAGYLNNYTPKRHLGWKTPMEALTEQKPSLSHLHVYGCRAYALNKHIPRLDKLRPRAHIGYFVGIDSTNIYRIWIPSQSKVIRTRDVTFDDELFYNPTKLDLAHILQEKTTELLNLIEVPILASENLKNSVGELGLDPTSDTESVDDAQEAETQESAVEKAPALDSTAQSQLRTPESTPDPPAFETELPAADNAHSIDDDLPTASRALTAEFDAQNILPAGAKRLRKARKQAYTAALERNSELAAFHSAFATGLNRVLQKSALYRDILPAEPRTWRQLISHLHGAEFRQAAGAEIQGLKRRGTFKHVRRSSVSVSTLPLL
jgi:hypothetical protein